MTYGISNPYLFWFLCFNISLQIDYDWIDPSKIGWCILVHWFCARVPGHLDGALHLGRRATIRHHCFDPGPGKGLRDTGHTPASYSDQKPKAPSGSAHLNSLNIWNHIDTCRILSLCSHFFSSLHDLRRKVLWASRLLVSLLQSGVLHTIEPIPMMPMFRFVQHPTTATTGECDRIRPDFTACWHAEKQVKEQSKLVACALCAVMRCAAGIIVVHCGSISSQLWLHIVGGDQIKSNKIK